MDFDPTPIGGPYTPLPSCISDTGGEGVYTWCRGSPHCTHHGGGEALPHGSAPDLFLSSNDVHLLT